jgi:hypothetical protein
MTNMLDNNKTGGPAFPCDLTMYDKEVQVQMQGMTLRDYFAAKAMPIAAGGLNQRGEDFTRPDQYSQLATDAYKLADAMLVAREDSKRSGV